MPTRKNLLAYVTVSNGEIYWCLSSNNFPLYDKVVITRDLDIVYEKIVYTAFEERAKHEFYENPEEVRDVLETIDNIKGGYLLLKSETNVRMGLFEINGNYYLADLSGRFGDVASLIGELKEKN